MPKVLVYPAVQRLEILSKEYLTTNDIMILCQVGKVTANKFRNKYKDWLSQSKIKVWDYAKVDTDLFVQFTNEDDEVPTIRVDRIEKFAKKGL